MSLSNIHEIQTDLKDGSIIRYTLFVADNILPEGTTPVEIILCQDIDDPETYVNPNQMRWNYNFGEFEVKCSDLSDDTCYYLFVRRGDETNKPVLVFTTPPTMTSYIHPGADTVSIALQPGSNDYTYASHISVLAGSRQLLVPMLECHIPTLPFDVNEGIFQLDICYYMEYQSVKVYGLYTSLPILISAPSISKIEFNGTQVTLEGTLATHDLYTDILQEQRVILSRKTENGILDLSDIFFFPDTPYELSFYYRDQCGQSKECTRFPLLSNRPEITQTVYTDGEMHIHLARKSVYTYTCNENQTVVCTDCIRVPANTSSIDIRYSSGTAHGPVLSAHPVMPGYYSFTHTTLAGNQFVYYLYADRPTVPTAPVTVPVQGEFDEYTEGIYFTLIRKSDSEAEFTAAITLLDAPAEARADYLNLLKTSVKNREGLQALTQALLSHIPIRREDWLYYLYQYDPVNGSTGLHPGMSLSVEYAVFQNVPDRKSKNDPEVYNGFVGTGTSEYSIILRHGKVTLSPFISDFIGAGAFTVPFSKITNMVSIGGAGESDLLCENFANVFMRLAYPKKQIDRTSAGSPNYYDNICFLSAGNFRTIEEAVGNRKKWNNNTQYATFRGRTTVTPLIHVFYNDTPCKLPLGTTLNDVACQMNIPVSGLLLKRCTVAGTYPVHEPVADFPLVAGDRITDRAYEAR